MFKSRTYRSGTFGIVLVWLLGIMLLVRCGPNMPDEVAEAYGALPEKIDFNFHVRPILSDRCFNCHGPDGNARKAKLRLDVKEGIFSVVPEKEIFPVVPGKPNQSELIKRILSQDLEVMMPTPELKFSLTDSEKATLVKWVEQGAEWKAHWAFTPPVKASLHKIKNSTWPQNEIDNFVLDKMEPQALSPSQEAERETLIRRLSFDLNGLPPSLGEINEFKQDSSENAYEKMVDRFLASPRYGERWAWEWLDVSRYSYTNGYQGDFTRDMWPWRDWDIQAFNKNMPYDEFTLKQLAGDLMPDAGLEDKIATAFNRNHPYNTEGGTIPEETRVVNVFDRVETTATTWLGLTMNCARCHDHKYDAITQKEYYQLFDFFNQTSEEGGGWGGKIKPLLNLGSKEKREEMVQVEAFVATLVQQVERFESKKFPRPSVQPAAASEVAKSLKGLDARILLKPANNRGTGEFQQLAGYFKQRDLPYGSLLQKLLDSKKNLDRLSSKTIQVMVMDNIEVPRPTFILDRGGYNKPPVMKNNIQHPFEAYQASITRRNFFGKMAQGIGAMALGSMFTPHILSAADLNPFLVNGSGLPHFTPKAKRVIYLFQNGAPSHVDLFDYKPMLRKWHGRQIPDELTAGKRFSAMTGEQTDRPVIGEISNFAQHGQSGAWVSDFMPETAKIADDLCFIKSMYTESVNHAPAITFFLTGSEQPGRPSMGSWLTYGLGSTAKDLPDFVAMTSRDKEASCGQIFYHYYWGSGFLPSKFQGVKFRGGGDPVLYLKNPEGMSREMRRKILDDMQAPNEMNHDEFGDPEIQTRIAQYEMAYKMQMSVPDLTDFSDEPKHILDMYGPDVHRKGSFAYNCLMARRLAERDVRFIQCMHAGWDQHTNLNHQLKIQCQDTDRPSAALIKDLKQRGMLEDTLVIWGGEFGRTPFLQGNFKDFANWGRDHHPYVFTLWIAGAGVKPGLSYGASDDFGFNPIENNVHVNDFQATVMHIMGIDHKQFTFKHQGRRYRLTDVHGHVVKDILS